MKIIHEIINRGKGSYGSGQNQITRDQLLRIYDERGSASGLFVTTIGSSGASTYNSVTGVLNIPIYSAAASATYLNDLLDVSTTGAVIGQALVLGAGGIWSAQSITAGSSITVNDSAPTSPAQGDQWLDTTSAILYTRVIDNDSSEQWAEFGPDGLGIDGAVLESRSISINGVSFDLSADRSWTVGTVTSIIFGTGLTGGTVSLSGSVAFDSTWGDSRYALISSLSSYTPTSRTLTINGVSFDLSVSRSWTVGTVTSVSIASANGFSGSVATSTLTPAITISTSITGVLKGNGTAISAAIAGTDYQSPISLTTTGNSGSSTFLSNTLNIPNYTLSGLGGVPTSRTITINGTAQDLSVNRSWSVGDVRTDSSYSNPAWITSLAWSKISTTPTTITGYGITDAVNKSGDTMTGFLTLHADPTQALHAVTKEYVDNVSAGLRAAPAVEVATTANLPATYSNGTLGVGATLTSTTNGAFPTIDGITIATTTPGQNGILIKNQSNSAHNGRYNLTQIGNGSTPWILTRCPVCDEADEIPGSYIFTKAGTTQSSTGWVAYVISPQTYVVGTDSIFYFQFSGAGTYVAGTGLTLTGNIFSANIGTSIQGWDADLDAIATLSGTSGYLVKTGTNTWSLDTTTHYSRVISVVTTNTIGVLNSGVDYIYLAANAISVTLPTAVLNSSIITVKNIGTATVTVNTTSSQTIDGSTSITIPVRYTSLNFVSDGSNWNII